MMPVTDPLHDLRHYSPAMTMTQLMKFCEKKDLKITRAMVQNYIRDGLLPPPVNKRFYTHKHLAALAMIDRLKTVFDIPTIQSALSPYMDEEGLPPETYFSLISKTDELTRNWLKTAAETLNAEDDGGMLLTMVCAAGLKDLLN